MGAFRAQVVEIYFQFAVYLTVIRHSLLFFAKVILGSDLRLDEQLACHPTTTLGLSTKHDHSSGLID